MRSPETLTILDHFQILDLAWRRELMEMFWLYSQSFFCCMFRGSWKRRGTFRHSGSQGSSRDSLSCDDASWKRRDTWDPAFSGRGFDQHQRRLQLKYDALALCCVCCFCCFCRVAFLLLLFFCFLYLFVLSRCFSLLDVSPVENSRIRVPHRPTQRSEGRVWGEGKVHLLHLLHLPIPLYSSLVSKKYRLGMGQEVWVDWPVSDLTSLQFFSCRSSYIRFVRWEFSLPGGRLWTDDWESDRTK